MDLPTFRSLFPAFNALADEVVQAQIDAANSSGYFETLRWGTFLNDGIGNFVAHNLAVANVQTLANATLSGDVTNKLVGDVTIGRDAELLAMEMKDPWMRTLYGQKYRYLSEQVGSGGTVI